MNQKLPFSNEMVFINTIAMLRVMHVMMRVTRVMMILTYDA